MKCVCSINIVCVLLKDSSLIREHFSFAMYKLSLVKKNLIIFLHKEIKPILLWPNNQGQKDISSPGPSAGGVLGSKTKQKQISNFLKGCRIDDIIEHSPYIDDFF